MSVVFGRPTSLEDLFDQTDSFIQQLKFAFNSVHNKLKGCLSRQLNGKNEAWEDVKKFLGDLSKYGKTALVGKNEIILKNAAVDIEKIITDLVDRTEQALSLLLKSPFTDSTEKIMRGRIKKIIENCKKEQ